MVFRSIHVRTATGFPDPGNIANVGRLRGTYQRATVLCRIDSGSTDGNLHDYADRWIAVSQGGHGDVRDACARQGSQGSHGGRAHRRCAVHRQRSNIVDRAVPHGVADRRFGALHSDDQVSVVLRGT